MYETMDSKGGLNMEFTLPETQMMMAALSCMYTIIAEPETEAAICIDYVTNMIMRYNKARFGIPVPDLKDPVTYPDNIQEMLVKFVDEYNTKFLHAIINKLISVENRDNMDEE